MQLARAKGGVAQTTPHVCFGRAWPNPYNLFLYVRPDKSAVMRIGWHGQTRLAVIRTCYEPRPIPQPQD